MSSSTSFLSVFLLLRRLRIPLVLAAVTFAACVPCGAAGGASHSLTPGEAVAVDRAVRAFMQDVSHSVTQNGPLAWLKYFDASSAFFMAVNGQMAFPNADAAQDGTRTFAKTIHQIELKWGDDLRVDALTNELAMVAVSWREIQVDNAGQSRTTNGYFTGLAERPEGHWKFRNAHWSEPVPSR